MEEAKDLSLDGIQNGWYKRVLTCSFQGMQFGADIPKCWEKTLPSAPLSTINRIAEVNSIERVSDLGAPGGQKPRGDKMLRRNLPQCTCVHHKSYEQRWIRLKGCVIRPLPVGRNQEATKCWDETCPSAPVFTINPTSRGEFDSKGVWFGRSRWAETKGRQNAEMKPAPVLLCSP